LTRSDSIEKTASAIPGLVIVAALAISGPCSAQSRTSYFDAVDTDHDQRISLAEFQERMSWAFRQMDHNADQILSPDEQLVPNAATMTLAELHQRQAAQFRRQDKNKDGWLSASEFLAPPG
jgi:Ca2+-binding EF-hand superfamily protein